MNARRHVPDGMLAVLARRHDTVPPRRIAEHLAGCARCRAVLSDLSSLSDQLRADPAAPGRTLLARVFALARPKPPGAREAARVPLARLIRDSGPELRVSGLRAADTVREQLWRIPGADVDVRLEPQGLGAPGLLQGQIFPRGARRSGEPDGSVWLLQRGRHPVWTALGEDGQFELPAPRAGRWTLWLEWNGVAARLESR